MKQLIVSLVLALCLVNTCSAIRCYQCVSTTDPNCVLEKPETKAQLKQVDCELVARPTGYSSLMPVTKCNTVVTKDRAGTIVSRDCHFEEYGEPNKCKVSHSQSIEKCQICDEALCNSASGYTALSVVVMLAVVAAILKLN